MAERRPSRWLAPAMVFGALAVLIIAQILTTPSDDTRQQTPALSSRSARANGARGLYETLARLGWRVERRTTSLRDALDTSAVYVVLDGVVPVSRGETHALLEAVRRGARLLVTPGAHPSLADSLGIASRFVWSATAAGPGGLGAGDEDEDEEEDEEPYIGQIDPAPPALARVADSAAVEELTSVARRLRFVQSHLEPLDSVSRLRVPFPGDTVSFLTARVRGGIAPVVLGIRLGAGRIVAVADPILFTNRRVREGESAVILVRALKWLTPERDLPLVFDEFHQSRFPSEGPGPIARAMLHHPLGRAGTQLLVAAALAILAIGARPLAPHPRLRTERRSPFEHVGALARAYEQVRATRTVTRRLVHGLRRRHPIGRHTGADEAYLGALAARYPDIAGEVREIRAALERPLEPDELLAVGQALDTIERKIES